VKKIHLKLIFILLICFAYGCTTKPSLRNDERVVLKSYQYLSDNVINSEYDEIDILTAEGHANVLTSFMEKYPTSQDEAVSMRYVRAKTFYAINTVRFVKGQKENIQQSNIAVDDIKFVVLNNQNPNKAVTYYRDAGRIIYHLTDEGPLAFYYYAKCAERNEGACLNNVAHGLFDGSYKVPFNIRQSMYLHSKAYETQLKYSCAGIYSASALVYLAYYYPTLALEDWKDWIRKRNELINKLGNSSKRKYCGYNSEGYFSDYVLYTLNDEAKRELLKSAMLLASEPNQKKMYLALLDNVNLDLAYNFFHKEAISADEPPCMTARSLLLMSNQMKNKQVGDKLEQYFLSLKDSQCRFSRSLIKHLKEEKRW